MKRRLIRLLKPILLYTKNVCNDIDEQVEIMTEYLLANDVSIFDEDTALVVRCCKCTEWDEERRECKHWVGFREDSFCSYGRKR